MAWPEISDDFSGTLDNWTQLSDNSLVISSGHLTGPYFDSDSGLVHNSALTTSEQFVEVQCSWPSPGYIGILMRGTGVLSTSDFVMLRVYGTWARIYKCDGIATKTLVVDDFAFSISNNDYIGIRISGATSATTIQIWNFGSSSGGDPSTWGASDYTSSSLDISSISSGNYVGIWIPEAPPWIDNFKAGGTGGGASAVPKIMLLQDHFSGGIH